MHKYMLVLVFFLYSIYLVIVFLVYDFTFLALDRVFNIVQVCVALDSYVVIVVNSGAKWGSNHLEK